MELLLNTCSSEQVMATFTRFSNPKLSKGVHRSSIRIDASDLSLKSCRSVFPALTTTLYPEGALLSRPERQHRVQPAKRERVRQCVLHLPRARGIGQHVEVAFRIGCRVIGRRRKNTVPQCERGGRRL